MTTSYLRYPLHPAGYIDYWLLAHTYAHWVKNLEDFPGTDFKLLIAQHVYKQESGLSAAPLEGESFAVDGQTLTWKAVRCPDDHMIDISVFHHNCHYLSAWAYAVIESDYAGPATFVLGTNGPADLWLNDAHVHRQEHFHHQDPLRVSFPVQLERGQNRILVRFEEVAARECPFTMALRVTGAPADKLRILLPTGLANVERRQAFEKLVWAVFCDRELYAGDAPIAVRWEDAPALADGRLKLALLDKAGNVAAHVHVAATAAGEATLIDSAALADGDYRLLIQPDEDLPVRAEIALHVMKNAYSEQPYATLEERRLEALREAAKQSDSVFAEIAKMALGRWGEVDRQVILTTLEGINNRRDCSDFFMVGLLGMVNRFGDNPSFPADLRGPIEQCVLNFKYWNDEPGDDVMCYHTENHSILFHTCEILAGQMYADRIFSNAGQNGAWHVQKGQRLARAWFDLRGKYGFHEWDSNTYFEEDMLALSHLVDFAADKDVVLLAEMTLHKMLVTAAVNSYHGVFGSTHGRTYTPYIKGARLEGTSGATRLLWGQGVFNSRILGTVAMACSQKYHLPPVIARIATTLPKEMLSLERHDALWDVSKVTYKTPDYMLCSAQDWLPGEFGYQQHIWQATLGPDAVVFSTQPPGMSEDNSRRPNYWHGNYILPRVAQHKDLLVAIYRLAEDDRLGFSHAYFPTYAFDEWSIQGGWAFARRGDGYLAITAQQGLDLTRRGKNAYRELRSTGLRNVWLCQMGRAALDGSFAAFQARVLALKPAWGDLSVSLTALRGERIAYGWTGPLMVNRKPRSLPLPHYDNPFCQSEWESGVLAISEGGETLTLDFNTPAIK